MPAKKKITVKAKTASKKAEKKTTVSTKKTKAPIKAKAVKSKTTVSKKAEVKKPSKPTKTAKAKVTAKKSPAKKAATKKVVEKKTIEIAKTKKAKVAAKKAPVKKNVPKKVVEKKPKTVSKDTATKEKIKEKITAEIKVPVKPKEEVTEKTQNKIPEPKRKRRVGRRKSKKNLSSAQKAKAEALKNFEAATSKANIKSDEVSMTITLEKKKEEVVRKKAKSNMKYSNDDLAIFHDRIQEVRKDAIEELMMLRERLDDLNNFDFAEESMIYSMHMAEQGSEAFEKEKTYAQIQRINEYIKKLDDALARIIDKTYGICRMCGCLIARARLMAVPITTLSASYKIQSKCPDDGIDRIEPLKK